MSVTTPQYERLLGRLTALENHANDMAIAMDSFVTLTQVNQLVVSLQSAVSALAEQVDTLEARVTAIEEEPLQ